MDTEQIRLRFTILTWAVGILSGLTIALLSSVITVSFQLGHITGRLDVLINHVTLR